MNDPDPIGVLRRPDRESGQATTEFALVLFPVLMLIAGIIYFGIALNYWLDMQRVANQGARWAAVNNWPPDCPRDSVAGDCDGDPYPTLQESLRAMAIADGLQSSVQVSVCYPSGPSANATGDPVRVRLETPFNLFWVTDTVQITLRAEATMRLEQSQAATTGLITNDGAPCS